MQLTLIRDIDDSRSTVGRIVHAGHEVVQTIEKPWVKHADFRAGTPFESCIPAGVYGLEPFQSSKYGETYALENEALGVFSHKDQRDEHGQPGDRYACLIHAANWAHELAGCIAPGEKRIEWQDTYMVTRSRDSLVVLLDLLARDERRVPPL